MMYAALIYSHSTTPRLQYIVDFLSHYYGLPFKLSSDEASFSKADIACKINYSYHRIANGEIWIHPHALLFESAIHQVKAECFQHKGHTVFFKTEGDVAFDLFAAVFYLTTRYEEYLPHKKDMYERYAHQNAIAFREGFLQMPLVNIWLEDFRDLLSEKNDRFLPFHTQFSFIPTYDIDMAWSYRNKGFERNAGAVLKLFLTGKWQHISKRLSVLRKKRQDPFDAYEWMDDLHHQYKLSPVYFFLVARQKGKYDRNIDVENKEFRQLVQTIAAEYEIGLHPSWASGDNPSLLSKEKTWLEKLVKHKVNASRQHYIRFDLPATYRHLLAAGITHDYSMGYGSINGFRASISTPYHWYDLKKEERTQLLIHPFCFMDANAYYEQNFSAQEALAEMIQYYQVIRQVNGTMITIWHNNFLGTGDEFEGWKEAYQQFISSVAKEII
jgi:hypothetical protein